MNLVNRLDCSIIWRAYKTNDKDRVFTLPDGEDNLAPGASSHVNLGQTSVTLLLTKNGKGAGTYADLPNSDSFMISEAFGYVDIINMTTIGSIVDKLCASIDGTSRDKAVWSRAESRLRTTVDLQRTAVLKGLNWKADIEVPDEYYSFVAWVASVIVPDLQWYDDIKALLQDARDLAERTFPSSFEDERGALNDALRASEPLLTAIKALRGHTKAPTSGTFRLSVDGKPAVQKVIDSVETVVGTKVLSKALSTLEGSPSFAARVAFGYAAMAIVQTEAELIKVLMSDLQGTVSDTDNLEQVVCAGLDQRAKAIKGFPAALSQYLEETLKTRGVPPSSMEGQAIQKQISAAYYPTSIEALTGADGLAADMSTLANDLRNQLATKPAVAVPPAREPNPAFTGYDRTTLNQDRTQYTNPWDAYYDPETLTRLAATVRAATTTP